MQKDLLQQLVDKPQRETSGSDAASRFDYQKNWAFCKMLQRHMENADYLVAFEFHDDVVFFNPATTPHSAEFCQVKTATSAKPRSLADLLAPKKKLNSILGKMFLNFEGLCADHPVCVILVSNVAFEFADRNLCAKDLDPKYRIKIIEKLKAEIHTFSEDNVDKLYFMISGVSIEAMHTYLHGQAVELFKSRFGEDHGFNVHSWVRLIQGEITRRNNYASDQITSVAELLSKKCIRRQDVEQSLGVISAQRRPAPDMSLVNQELLNVGWTALDLMRLGKRLPEATADYTDPTNSDVSRIVASLDALFDNAGPSAMQLAAYICLAEKELLAHLPPLYNNRLYLAALSLVVYHEKL